MLLHNDKDLFAEVIYSASTELGLPVPIVEKDYYVTVILKEMAEKAPDFLILRLRALCPKV